MTVGAATTVVEWKKIGTDAEATAAILSTLSSCVRVYVQIIRVYVRLCMFAFVYQYLLYVCMCVCACVVGLCISCI